jgi:hypothetical protein
LARSGGKARPIPGTGKPRGSRARDPIVSVIMPVRDGAYYIAEAIDGLRRSTFQAYELIVVDDASSDGSGDIAAAMGAVVISPGRWGGAPMARMAGVERSRGEILAFIDADVVVHPDALSKIVARFDADPRTSAIIGGYDDAPSAPSVLSRFRNLLHTYFHRRGDSDARTFWTGLGAVRRSPFEALGGFAGGPMDDVEFGVRLHEAGYRIALDTSIQGTHLKDWTLVLMVRTDIFLRGAPWIRLALERGFFRNDLNTSAAQRASVAAAGALLAVAIGGLLSGLAFVAAVAGVGLALSVAAWGDADRTPLPLRSLLVLVLLSLSAAGGLLLAGAWPAAFAIAAAAIVRILGRPAYRPKADAAGVALVTVIGVAVALSIATAAPSPWGIAALTVAAFYASLSWRILAFMGARMGGVGGVAALPLLFVYHVCCGLAVVLGLAGHLIQRSGAPWKVSGSTPRGGRA